MASAVLSAGVLAASSAFAVDLLDYANSVGQVDEADTVNWVIGATSDGGYVAGGQTVQCFKQANMIETFSSYGGRGGSGDYADAVSMSECVEYFEEYPDAVWWNKEESLVSQICGHSGGSVEMFAAGRGAAEGYYYYSCVDYITKIKQNGDKEWLTTLDTGEMPVAVGETNGDYRLITERGEVYTVNKSDGADGIVGSISSNYSYFDDAIVNKDGTTIADSRWDGGVTLYAANGSVVRRMRDLNVKPDDVGDQVVHYIEPGMIEGAVKPLVKSADGGILAARYVATVSEIDEEGEPEYSDARLEIVKLSSDLRTATPVVTITAEDAEESGIDIVLPISSDSDGNIMAFTSIYNEESGSSETYVVSYDKTGKQLAAKKVQDVLGITDEQMEEMMDDPDVYASKAPKVLSEFTVMDPINNKLRRLSPQLTDVYSYALAEGETINDVTALTDSSLAGVGGSTKSTTNYAVTGAMNGTYLRLAKINNNNTANPQTSDDFKMIAAGAAVVVLVAGGLIMKGGKRC